MLLARPRQVSSAGLQGLVENMLRCMAGFCCICVEDEAVITCFPDAAKHETFPSPQDLGSIAACGLALPSACQQPVVVVWLDSWIAISAVCQRDHTIMIICIYVPLTISARQSQTLDVTALCSAPVPTVTP